MMTDLPENANDTENGDATPKIDAAMRATRDILDVLLPLPNERRIRVIKAAAALHGIDLEGR